MVQRCGYVAIVGRPNVGKSTLMNHLIGQKVSITSRRPQTTRNQVLGIDTHTEGDEQYQVIYVDTPGLHREEPRAINRMMNRAAQGALGAVDLVLFLVDPFGWNDDDELAFHRVRQSKLPTVLVINKVDKVKDKQELLPLIEKLSAQTSFSEIVPVSALQGTNLDELKKIIDKALPEQPLVFPEDMVTDRSVRYLAAELVREKLMRQMGAELPYSSTVEIERFTENEELCDISATILVERAGQRKMVIGKDASRLKKIGTQAREELERLLGCKVMLRLFVKVKSGWADDVRALKSLGLDGNS